MRPGSLLFCAASHPSTLTGMQTRFLLCSSLLVSLAGCSSAAGSGDACHDVSSLDCAPADATLLLLCAEQWGSAHATPLVCENVSPPGNCRALETIVTCTDAVVGRVWCCGEDTASTCALHDDSCDGPTSVELADRCATALGSGYGQVVTCGLNDGPADCFSLSAYSPGLRVTCGSALDLAVWCCRAPSNQ